MQTRALIFATLTLLLAACDTKTETSTTKTETQTTPAADPATPATPAAAGTADSGAKADASTLVIQQSADIPTLDPGTTYDTSSGQIVENLYEPLVGYKGSSISDLQGVLATEWKEEDGGLKYRFTLRPNVKFHTGNPMTCADAEYTFERNLVTNTGDSGNWFISESLLGTPKNAVDDPSITWERIDQAVECDGETLVFTLPKVDPAFVSKLAYTGQSIVDSKHAKEIGEWDGTEKTWKEHVGKELNGSPLAQKPSGTGPYMLVSRDNANVTTKAFGDYWGGKPKIENVVLKIVPEEASRLQALLRGDADFVETGGRPMIDEQLRGKEGIAILDNLPDTYVFGISMNQKIADGADLGSGKLDGQGIPADFFSDVDVRRGFASAFNVQDYIDQVQQGKGTPRNFQLPDTFPGYDKSIPAQPFDMEAATAAFKKAWGGKLWDTGFTINASYRQGSVPAQTAMEMLKANIESINPKFKINIQPKQWSEILASAKDGKEILTTTSWAPDYADPDNFVYTFYHKDGYYKSRTALDDAEINGWIEEARTTTDPAKRQAAYSKVAKKALDQAYFILMPTNPGIRAYRSSVQGVSEGSYNPMYAFGLGTLWKDLSKQ
ncbi:ABC transporter substrate-binding protein [Deinococcus lacus]|uniref:ABC transporter substrate-binding protein n=1 Tax=Deinococcus lacus TaxID=392561 RepID=A0ABW1YEA2_9DEIO